MLDEKILATAFQDKKYAMELSSTIGENYFSGDNKLLYLSLMHFFNNPNIKSIPTKNMLEEYLSDYAGASGVIKKYDEIIGLDVDGNEFTWLVEKLKSRYNNTIQVELNKNLDSIFKTNKANKDRVTEINKLIKETVVAIDGVHRSVIYKEGTLGESVTERMNYYKYIKENPEAAQGVLTGFSTFDQKTNGLHAGEFMIIAGGTGTGKSVLMHNIAVNAYLGKNDPFNPEKKWDDSGKNVLYFSLEMPKATMERRIDSCIGEIYSKHIRDGLLNDDDELKYFRTLQFQENYNKFFHIVDMPQGATTREIELKYLELCDKGMKPDLVVIDYMGIMCVNDASGQDWMDLGVISEELHGFARVYEIAVITGSQVNRTKDGQERYDTDRLARSSMIANNADIVIQIAKRTDEHLKTDMQVHIIKLRDGDQDSFLLVKDFAKMKVMDLLDTSFNDDDDDEDMI